MKIKYYGNDGQIRSLGDNELAHYNHNHDKLGRFAKSMANFVDGGANEDFEKLKLADGVSVSTRQMRKAYKKMMKDSDKLAKNKNRYTEYRDEVRKEAQQELKSNKKYQKLDKELDSLANKMMKNSEEIDKIIVNKEWSNSEEYNKIFSGTSDGKKLEKLVKEGNSLESQYSKKLNEFNKERYKTTDKYLGKYADATMSDLNLNDDSFEQVRKFIIRTTPDSWDISNRTVGQLSNTVVSYTDITKRQKERKARVNAYEKAYRI